MKQPTNLSKAVECIPDGSSLMVGGFMGVGTPDRILSEIVSQNKKGLTVIANDTARPSIGIGKLIDSNLVSKCIVSHIGTNPETQKQMIEKTIEVELSPQGTLAERIRSGGYGLGGFLTRTALETLAAEGKQIITINNENYLLELPLRADFALIKASNADYHGNLQYRLTARNFNPLMAMAADTVIAEVDEMLPIGCITPDQIHTPGILIDHIVTKGANHD